MFILNSPDKNEDENSVATPNINNNNNSNCYLFIKYGAYDLLSADDYYNKFNKSLISIYTPYQTRIINKNIIVNESFNQYNIHFTNYLTSSQDTEQEICTTKGI